jgi:hypothetical protein
VNRPLRADGRFARRWVQCVASLGVVLVTACARPAARTITPAPLQEDHCWWAVLRSARSPDSVAARFTQAFRAIGFSSVAHSKQGDTVWATAGPTDLGPVGAMFASRAVAYWHGDSTHFRYFVAVGRSTHTQVRDTVARGRLLIDMCTQIARAARIGWSAPVSPTGDEELTVWHRRP